MRMRCEFGYCLVCDAEIADACKECGARKPNSKYTEVHLPTSDGSKLVVAVCTDCAPKKVWESDKREMMQAVQNAWQKQPGGSHKPDLALL